MFSETPWVNVAEKLSSLQILESSQTNKETASPGGCSNLAEGNNSLSDSSGSTSNRSETLHRNARVQLDYLSRAPQRLSKSKKNGDSVICMADTFEKPNSHNSCKNHRSSAQNSPDISPVLLRCKSSGETQISDRSKALDVYTDQEQHEIVPEKDYQGPSCTGDYHSQTEYRMIPSLGCPPRVLHMAPVSPNYGEEKMMSCSFREEKGSHHHVFIQDDAGDNLQPPTPWKYAKKITQTLDHELSGTPKGKLQDYGSETTTTIEDIYEDTSDLHYSFQPNNPAQSSAHVHLDPMTVPTDTHSREDAQFLERLTCFLGDDLTCSKHESSICLEKHEEKTDRELIRKLKEMEEKITLLPEVDPDIEKFQNGGLCMSSLEQMLSNIIEDRKNLKMELSFQLHCRIAERSLMKAALKQAKIDLDTKTRKVEEENNEFQTYLENELDRRSGDWLLKLEKLEAEEHRLRTRMREVAEQNVSLQRQISFLSGREMEARSRIMDSELQFNSLAMKLEEARNENERLSQGLSELQELSDGAKADRDCIATAYKEKERESKELQKAVVRLQRMCNEQEITINGLGQGFSDEVMKQSLENGDLVRKLQNEQLRLAGVEQKLRREVESYRFEVGSLRHENIHLLERLQGNGSSCGISLFRLDQELLARIDCLKNEGVSLLDDSSKLCAKLLEFVKGKQSGDGQKVVDEFNGYTVVEFNVKFQNLREAIKTFRRSLQTVSSILDEKSTTGSSDGQLQTPGSGLSTQLKCNVPLDKMEHDLKMQILLTRVLQEKLYHKELDLEQLQAELASSVGSNEILKSEIQRLQDGLSCLRHKTNEMELQMLEKDDNLDQLHIDLQECKKELTKVRGTMPQVSEERDRLWEEVKQLKEINMLLQREVKYLIKKIEALDEDLLIKDGQITMLKDSLHENPFTAEFSLE
ncbi:hypothetical protein Taro_049386 [Colocasia esculenta]|uniref:DUF7653 domain-containing protein n=1 Tax=Colocasia esculenta TaxID=4460 RepID=A0A843XAQ3_COLES|nr:hypothetical protein [Colocasia esculenta]